MTITVIVSDAAVNVIEKYPNGETVMRSIVRDGSLIVTSCTNVLRLKSATGEVHMFPVLETTKGKEISAFDRVHKAVFDNLSDEQKTQILTTLHMEEFVDLEGTWDEPEIYFPYDHLENNVGRRVRFISGMEEGSKAVRIDFLSGPPIYMYGKKTCCERKDLIDIAGDLADLIGFPLNLAEEVSGSQEVPEKVKATIAIINSDDDDEFEKLTAEEVEEANRFINMQHKWTYYRLGTIRGSVSLRWLSTHNGYYSDEILVSSGTGELLEEALRYIGVKDLNYPA